MEMKPLAMVGEKRQPRMISILAPITLTPLGDCGKGYFRDSCMSGLFFPHEMASLFPVISLEVVNRGFPK